MAQTYLARYLCDQQEVARPRRLYESYIFDKIFLARPSFALLAYLLRPRTQMGMVGDLVPSGSQRMFGLIVS